MRTVTLVQCLTNNGYSLVVEKNSAQDFVRVSLRRSYLSRKRKERVVVTKFLGDMYKEGFKNLAREMLQTADFS